MGLGKAGGEVRRKGRKREEERRRARGASKVKESIRELVDLSGLSKRVSRFVVCTSSTKNPFPSNVHERPREHPSSTSLLRTASDIRDGSN